MIFWQKLQARPGKPFPNAAFLTPRRFRRLREDCWKLQSPFPAVPGARWHNVYAPAKERSTIKCAHIAYRAPARDKVQPSESYFPAITTLNTTLQNL